MVLDSKKAKTLDCNACTTGMQALRNCDGRGSPAKVELNNQLYRRCPRAIMLENPAGRYLVNLFLDCRRMNIYPYPGGPAQQTAFATELFDFLEAIVSEHQHREAEKARKEAAPKK